MKIKTAVIEEVEIECNPGAEYLQLKDKYVKQGFKRVDDYYDADTTCMRLKFRKRTDIAPNET